MKSTHKLLNIVTASMLAALCCVATMVIQIPTPTGGFVNLGDTVVILSACLLPPVYAFLAAGIGSALADILAGYIHYSAATFIIKGLMALTVWFLLKAFRKLAEKNAFLSLSCTVISATCAEILMIGGYFLFEATILSYGMGAAVSIIPNTIQGVAGIVCGTLLSELLKRTKIKAYLNT